MEGEKIWENMGIWKKVIREKLDEVDLRILKLLLAGRDLTDREVSDIAKKLRINKDEVKDRISILSKKGVILKTNSALIDPIKLWDEYLIVMVKANLSPPVIGVEINYPRGWTEIIEKLKETERELGINIIRQAYALQGTEWDLLLIITTQDLNEYQEFGETLIKQGWIEKIWSIRPFELKGKWFFDPVEVPSPMEYVKNVKLPLKHLK
ncbi:MAG: Lrp/AsnC family transcriptional regulator [Candidatus Micrarchaeia archaeon]